ncbi:Conserved_hypothetical protein [Hexamita inflata]|uniref:Uncharacterized protein n=1 Tax=Hexamita inflata TaxID=28002 RepID=A0ABP1HQW6_9EUKA
MEVSPQSLYVQLSAIQNPTTLQEATATIFKMRTFGKQFIEAAFTVATGPGDYSIYARIAAAIELRTALESNMKFIEQNYFIQILTSIIPAANSISSLNAKALMNNLQLCFEKMFDQFRHMSSKYTKEPLQICGVIFQQICQTINMDSVMQTDFGIQCFTCFQRLISYEMYKEFKNESCGYFYQTYLVQLIQFIVGLDIESFQQPKFIHSLTQALRSFFEPREVEQLYSNPAFSDLPIGVTYLFQKLSSSEKFELQNAKEDCCYILLRSVQKVRRLLINPIASSSANQSFIEKWDDLQVDIAKAIIVDIKQCEHFNLFADHDSINSVFCLACELLELNSFDNKFCHEKAGVLLMEHADELVQQIFLMIINAGNVRMEHFEHDDLLVIDCLKPSVDFVRQICMNNSAIENGLCEQAQQALSSFLSGSLSESDYKEQENEAKIFVGTLLIRRALPNIGLNIKNLVCLRGLQMCTQLHEIVFEEIAKLIIQVTFDDYSFRDNYKFISSTSFDAAFVANNNYLEEDVVPYIIDLMIQLYCSDQPRIFQYRMLSGILSRSIRNNMVQNNNIIDLLTKSLLIMLNNEGQTQSGGMVTLTKVAISVFQSVDLDPVLCQILSTPDFQDLPNILVNNNQKTHLKVDNAFNILNLIIENVSIISSNFESSVVDLCTRILYVNFDLSTSVFKVLNNFYTKEIQNYRDAPDELFDVCLNGFAQAGDKAFECLGEALVYIKSVMRRHAAQIVIKQDIRTSLIQLIDSLVQRNTITSLGYATILLSQFLDVVVSEYSVILPQIFDYFTQNYFIPIFSQELAQICGEIDPDMKRMCLFNLATFFFTMIGVSEAMSPSQVIIDLLQTQNGIVSLVSMSFVATWALQDHKYNLGGSWRFTLASYICCSVDTLFSGLSAHLPILLPTLLWCRYIVLAARDYSVEQPPQISFYILQQLQISEQLLQPIFAGLFSEAIAHAQLTEQIDCPFWNRNEATQFGDALKIIGGCSQEASRFGISAFGGGLLLGRVLERVKMINVALFGVEYQAYVQRVIQTTGSMPDMNIDWTYE